MRKTFTAVAGLVAVLALTGTPAQAAGKEPAGGTARAKLLTLDYVSAEVADVIRALAAQSGINVALNPNAKGQVTVHLREKTVDDALMVVANLAGLGARKVNDTYVIAPRAEMKQTLERLGETRTISVRHIGAQAAADLAQAAFPDLTARPQAKAVALLGASEDLAAASRLIEQNDVISPEDVRTMEKIVVRNRPAAQVTPALLKMAPGLSAEAAGDSVVLAGTKAQVDAAKRGLEMMDVPAQPDADMRVYPIKYTPPAQLVMMLERAVPDVQIIPGPESAAPSKPGISIISGQFIGLDTDQALKNENNSTSTQDANGQKGAVNKNALSLLLKGSPASLDQAFKVLEMVDVPPKQLVIETKVVETSPDVAEQYGLKWSWTRFGFYEAPKGTSVSTGSTGGPGGDFTEFNTRSLNFGALSRVPWSFQAILSAMITKRDAKLLASPQISVINDQEASIFIGDTLRFQTLATSSPTTGTQFTVVEVPVGIILAVHPRVNDDGNITLRVHPVVSTVSGLVNGLPQTSAREAETTVRVKDGETFVIGGLIRDEDIREMSKIPILGDLPLIGNLFRNVSRNHRRSEVMVALTIHLVR